MLAIALVASEAGADIQSATNQESTDWASTFRDDLQAARRIILESHPGPVDALNPGFRDWLDAGYEEQMALADSVDTANAYIFGMRRFIGGFRDGHLGIRFEIDGTPARWPGFFAAWRDDTVVVHNVDPALVPELTEGDRLLSCDGQAAEQLVVKRVFDFQFDPSLPASWTPAAARAFVDFGNPFVGVPTQCVFIRENREFPLDLEWREVSWDDRGDDYSAARGRTRPEVGLFLPEPGVFWLQASTFGPNEAQIEKYEEALQQLREMRATAKLVVLDLRGNNGGSSTWADLFAEALWDRLPDDNETDTEYVEWRVSAGNIAYWETVPAILRRQFGDSHSAIDWSTHVLRNLKASLAEDRDLWRETPVDGDHDSVDAATAGHSDAMAPRYEGTVVLLTDTTCGSACLDAMSLLTDLPDVVHVGSVTSADTQYMEARPQQLPSEFATLVIPIKVYRGRMRPDGGYFTPAFQFKGLHWTDEAVRAWVLSLWREGTLESSELIH